MTAQYTPAPAWRVRERNGSVHIIQDNGDHSAPPTLVTSAEHIVRCVEAHDDLLAALKAVMEALRIHAPGTPLNNHRFDQLGIDAYAAIAKATKPSQRPSVINAGIEPDWLDP